MGNVVKWHRVRESVNKSAASAATPDYVKIQAVIKSAASAASLRGGCARGRLDHSFLFAFLVRASSQKIVKVSENGLKTRLIFFYYIFHPSSQAPGPGPGPVTPVPPNIFHPSSQAPGPGLGPVPSGPKPGACEKGWKI